MIVSLWYTNTLRTNNATDRPSHGVYRIFFLIVLKLLLNVIYVFELNDLIWLPPFDINKTNEMFIKSNYQTWTNGVVNSSNDYTLNDNTFMKHIHICKSVLLNDETVVRTKILCTLDNLLNFKYRLLLHIAYCVFGI